MEIGLYRSMEPGLYDEDEIAKFEKKKTDVESHRMSIIKQKRPPKEHEITAIGTYNLALIE